MAVDVGVDVAVEVVPGKSPEVPVGTGEGVSVDCDAWVAVAVAVGAEAARSHNILLALREVDFRISFVGQLIVTQSPGNSTAVNLDG